MELISKKAAIDAVNGLIDRFEQILRDIRETNVDDSVCGMCEYDGAYISQSGDWCNECPGFDKDDCFKLSDKTRKKWTEEIIKALPPIQPKRGKWIRTGSGSLYDHYECSECGKAPKWDCMGDNRWKIAFTDFCPNCGAKMEVTT